MARARHGAAVAAAPTAAAAGLMPAREAEHRQPHEGRHYQKYDYRSNHKRRSFYPILPRGDAVVKTVFSVTVFSEEQEQKSHDDRQRRGGAKPKARAGNRPAYLEHAQGHEIGEHALIADGRPYNKTAPE